MSKKEIQEYSLPLMIKNYIIKDIVSGKLEIGAKIIEAEYAEKLNVSRAPVREAILMLSKEGFAEKIPRKGTIVKLYSLEETVDLYKLRFYLELEAIIKIMEFETIDPTFLANLKEINEKMKIEKNIETASRLNYQLHLTIIRYANSRVLLDNYPPFTVFLHSLYIIGKKKERHHDATPMKEHDCLIEAIEKKNKNLADQILTKHYKDTIAVIKKQI